MDEIQLDVQIRKETGRRQVKKLRQNDILPGVVYGGKQKKPTVIQLPKKSYEKIMRTHAGQSVLFHLNVLEGEMKLRDYAAIVKEEQHDPVEDHLVHVDFQRVSLKEEIEVEAPIALVGEAVGVKKDHGSVDQPLHALDVVCLPTNIPEKIEVDISALEIGDALHVKDLSLPEGVKTKHDPEAIIVSVVPPMKDEEEQVDEDAEPEVIGQGEKKEASADESAKEKEEKPPAEG